MPKRDADTAGLGSGGTDTGRKRRRLIIRVSSIASHFAGPSYQAEAVAFAGGKKSTATLGPNALSGMGSDSVSNRPGGIASARRAYPSLMFISGHLLNAEFGGDGNDSTNVTILTSGANGRHKGFDNPIKRAVENLYAFYSTLSLAYVDIKKVRFGIEVSIGTSDGKWGDSTPGSYICNELHCSARLTGVPRLDTFVDSNGDAVILASDEAERARHLIGEIRRQVGMANSAGARVDNTS